MSDHRDHAVAERDITDLFVFQKPQDPDKTILVMNVNPNAPTEANAFDPEAIYEFTIDGDADAVADVAFRISFAPPQDGGTGEPQSGTQTATVRLATGDAPAGTDHDGQVIVQDAPASFDREPRITASGDYRFFAGIRSDPFFVDVEGVFDNFQWTGKDSQADRNVFGIVLEVPNRVLGPNPRVGVWARVLIPHGDDGLVQADRAGRSFTNGVFNIGNEEGKNYFNQAEPSQDKELFLAPFAAALQGFGHYSADEAAGIVDRLLPDVLPYDALSAAGYPNGRKLTDDVADATWAMVTNGTATDDGIGPHADLLPDFPYLGPPH